MQDLYLNTAGEDSADETLIEFNNLLCHPGAEKAIAAAISDHLARESWDSLTLNGFVEGAGLDALEAAFGDTKWEKTLVPSYYVNLARLRQTNNEYESVLGPKVRKHLRQNFRMYGDVHIDEAGDVPGALEMLNELAELHQRSWIARGQPGVFSSPRFIAFHRALITRAFSRGGIQLLRVATKSDVIGILYNFIYRNKVYFYQSGLQYGQDRRMRPGFVSLARAIQFCVARGLDDFDFLAGDADYKQWLSTDCRQLAWLSFQKRSMKWRVFELLRRARHWRSTD